MGRNGKARVSIRNLTLVQKFNIISLVLMVSSSIVIGYWVSSQIETRVVERAGHTTSLYTVSIIAPSIRNLLEKGSELEQSDLIHILDASNFGNDIVALKLWDSNGRILYSTNPGEIGNIYQMEAGLQQAWEGIVSTEISELDREEHEAIRGQASKLLETYSPIREPGTGEILAVVEFYQSVSEFEDEIVDARRKSWLIVCSVVGGIYLSLILLVGSGNRTILRQRNELDRRVQEYRRLLDRNIELTKRVQSSAEQLTDLNERYLRKIAAELHDGPAQDIGYSLLMTNEDDRNAEQNIGADIKSALERSLQDIRDISAGLKTPELEALSLKEVAEKAVRVQKNRSGGDVQLSCQEIPLKASLAVKITLFRVIQEALSNAHRHSGDDTPEVFISGSDGYVSVVISDKGSGFSPNQYGSQGSHLGISFMKERVELLRGEFKIISNSRAGTSVQVNLPINSKED